jgi:hypothetical protein
VHCTILTLATISHMSNWSTIGVKADPKRLHLNVAPAGRHMLTEDTGYCRRGGSLELHWVCHGLCFNDVCSVC